MSTNHRINPREGIDPQVLAHLHRVQNRACVAERVVAWVAALGTAALVGLVGVIVLPTAADVTEQAPAVFEQGTT